MAAGRIVIPNYMPALDINGAPVAGAKIYFYLNQTTTLQSVYSSEDLTFASSPEWRAGSRSPCPASVRPSGLRARRGARPCQLQRHRLFESNIDISPPSACRHDARPVIGVYGGHARRRAASAGGRGTRDVWEGGHRAAMSEAMGMTWATCAEMSEAIPPAYTEHLGRQLIAHIIASRQEQSA